MKKPLNVFLTGYKRLAPSAPCFVEPIFSDNNVNYICDRDQNDIVIRITNLSITEGIDFKYSEQDDIFVSIGSKFLFAFEIEENNVIIGDRNYISNKIRPYIDKFSHNHLLWLDALEFIGDSKALRTALIAGWPVVQNINDSDLCDSIAYISRSFNIRERVGKLVFYHECDSLLKKREKLIQKSIRNPKNAKKMLADKDFAICNEFTDNVLQYAITRYSEYNSTLMHSLSDSDFKPTTKSDYSAIFYKYFQNSSRLPTNEPQTDPRRNATQGESNHSTTNVALMSARTSPRIDNLTKKKLGIIASKELSDSIRLYLRNQIFEKSNDFDESMLIFCVTRSINYFRDNTTGRRRPKK